MDAPLVIVTTAHEGDQAGCLVGFHSQCSIEPPMYAVWLSVLNRTYRVASAARILAIHLLDQPDHDLAQLFGGDTGDHVNKFDRCDWSAGPAGVPLLDRCPNRFVLDRLEVAHTAGDHVCFAGYVLAADQSTDVQLLRLDDAHDITAGHPPDEP
jgi:flavin reductase (DIM6/NTAB) family NADH-FMN oxidoreductase RutF